MHIHIDIDIDIHIHIHRRSVKQTTRHEWFIPVPSNAVCFWALTHTHTCTYIHTYTYIHVYVFTYMYICIITKSRPKRNGIRRSRAPAIRGPLGDVSGAHHCRRQQQRIPRCRKHLKQESLPAALITAECSLFIVLWVSFRVGSGC